MGLPLGFGDPLCVLHYLSRPLWLASHFEVLCVLEHGHRHLLGRHFVAAPFNDLPGSLVLVQSELNASGDEPDFPLDVVWAALNRVSEVTDRLFVLRHAVVCLCHFNVNLPVELFRHVLEHFVKDSLQGVKLVLASLLVQFLVQSQVLEPERPVLRVVVKALFADFE